MKLQTARLTFSGYDILNVTGKKDGRIELMW